MSALAYLFQYLEPELKSLEQVQEDCGPFYAKFACGISAVLSKSADTD